MAAAMNAETTASMNAELQARAEAMALQMFEKMKAGGDVLMSN